MAYFGIMCPLHDIGIPQITQKLFRLDHVDVFKVEINWDTLVYVCGYIFIEYNILNNF